MMPEEVTYATLKFPNLSKSKKIQKSHSLKRTDNHEVPELELNGTAEHGPRRVESTAKVAESRAVKGHSGPFKVWDPVAFILLMLNLVVLAGLETLILMNYQKLFFSNRTAYDRPQSITEQLEKNIILYMNMYRNVSSEHSVLKTMFENKLKDLNNSISQCYEDLKQKKNEFECCSCSKSWIQHIKSRKDSFSLRYDHEKNGNKTQLFFTWLPSPVFWTDLNYTFTKTNKTAVNVSESCLLAYELICPFYLASNKGSLNSHARGKGIGSDSVIFMKLDEGIGKRREKLVKGVGDWLPDKGDCGMAEEKNISEQFCDNTDPCVTEVIMNVGLKENQMHSSLREKSYDSIMSTQLILRTKKTKMQVYTISSRCQLVNGRLPNWSHDHNSLIAKQSMKKGYQMSGNWEDVAVLVKESHLPPLSVNCFRESPNSQISEAHSTLGLSLDALAPITWTSHTMRFPRLKASDCVCGLTSHLATVVRSLPISEL
ncbi:uncharacterized protein V5649_014880 [Rhynchonycteris naso]